MMALAFLHTEDYICSVIEKVGAEKKRARAFFMLGI
jgi:hypothetical protein